ncbi:NtaA/DmoA family FMN-dependent monooxygenase [Frondihabitans australicus]|uniref:FMN-dependent oxidoreductase (Nitrilotriacetate monooxygenase family) n=1 Tax=Frondihabitans australicus TaxID=386892 RepID=A0A495IGQ6_9MICO|nr:NtaA/DmoA family FMN-dependent monooxygenase [Frondihabitans australicus]RKR75203.1 FMN-dependent oxidoreductase (nitrilotriacetate monooxygenase family) [Frondihabitans australicus]
MTTRELALGAVLVGVGDASTPELWRDPAIPLDASVDIDWYVKQAREAESSLFDFVFIVDSQYVDAGFPNHHLNRLEPLTLLSAVAYATSRIGLVATVSTTYSEPFDIARRIASLDLISHGRAGWNIVTSQDPGTAGNFSRDAHGGYGTRYRRATESVEVVRGLWSSYDDDAFATSHDAPAFLNPAGQHRLDHVGEFFQVTGPLNIQRSPQGEPVLIQAGASDEGRDLSAKAGEVIFSFSPTLASALSFADDVTARALELGRSRDELLFVPGLSIALAATDAEAQALHTSRLRAQPLGPLLARLARTFGGHSFADTPLDEPFPEVDTSTERGALRGAQELADTARANHWTLRDALDHVAASHWATFVGSPATVAAEIVRWFDAGAADGFNLFVQYPADWQLFRDEVVPLLRSQGVFRDSYEGSTLRSHLGLAVPSPLLRPVA